MADDEFVKLQCGAAEVHIYLHGAHVTYWRAHNGREVMYLSPKAILDNPKKAIRGGIPICWPQFGNFGPLAAHGYARVSRWALDSKSESETESVAILKLPPFAHPAPNGLPSAGVTYTVKVGVNSLTVELSVENSPGSNEITFTGALHSYFAVPKIGDLRIAGGLAKARYLDNLNGSKLAPTTENVELIDKEIDRIYLAVPEPVTFTFQDKGQTHQTTVQGSAGLPDVVLWNPWIEKTKRLGDMPEDGYKNFFCVEAAVVEKPVKLAEGSVWKGSQTITVSTQSSNL